MNEAGLCLYGATSRQELLAGLPAVFTDETYDSFREALVAMADGETVLDAETPVRTLQGEKRHVLLRWAVAPGSEQTLARVYISQTDITDRKRAEEALQRSERALSPQRGYLPIVCGQHRCGDRADRFRSHDRSRQPENVAAFR